MHRNKGYLNWRERTTKMATSEKLSMAGELLCDLRAKSYDTCLSNLTKTHCVISKSLIEKGCWRAPGLHVKDSLPTPTVLCQMHSLICLVSLAIKLDLLCVTTW